MISKTLVILSPGFPKDEKETNCVPSVQQFVLSIKKNYPYLKIIVFTFQYPFVPLNYTWNGIDVVAFGGKNKSGIWRLFNLWKVYKKLNTIYKLHGNFWLLSFWLTECSLIGKYFCERKKLKYFLWLQGQDAKKENKYIKLIKPKVDKLIAISDFIQEEFERNFNVKPKYVIENGLNTTAFPTLNTNQRSIDIIGVGSLTDVKNYSFFIEIIYELKKTYPVIKVVIVGDGEQKNKLNLLINELHLTNTIELIGLKTHQEVLQLLPDSKLFLHTSKFEGTPAVVMEALYSGCFAFTKQKLANRKIENHTVCTTKIEFVNAIHLCLNKPLHYKRVLANDMDDSAKKMIDLFLKEY